MLIEPNLKTVTKRNGHGKHRLRMSYDEFRAWADEDVHAEWVDGEVIVFDMVKFVHQSVIDFLVRLIGLYLSATKAGTLISAPYGIQIPGRPSHREPDLMFVKAEHEYRITDEWLDGAADLVIEIVSKESAKRDYEDKFYEYEAAGIPEYWIIDSRRKHQKAHFYTLDETGKYKLSATEKDQRVDSLIMPGFWLKPAWLWKSNVLDPLYCFAEMRGIDPKVVELLLK